MRMVDFPIGLPVQSLAPGGGPDVLGTSVSQTKFTQTVMDPFGGLFQLQMGIAPMRKAMARAFSRLSVSAQSGANCFRVNFCDPDEPGWDELESSVYQSSGVVSWAHGENWAHGKPWRIGKPPAAVVMDSEMGSGVITLDLSTWNGVLPTYFGIVGHFAVYSVTGAVFNGDVATCRVWPPVRRAIAKTDYATLRPVLAMRLADASGAPWSRGVEVMDGAQLNLVEVPDEVVRNYVTEDL